MKSHVFRFTRTAVAGFGCMAVSMSAALAGVQLAPPVRIQAGQQPIDMAQGAAAPFVMDFDGDGVRDLLVGQRGECKLRIFRNTGSNTAPRFGASAWFKAGGVEASLPGG